MPAAKTLKPGVVENLKTASELITDVMGELDDTKSECLECHHSLYEDWGQGQAKKILEGVKKRIDNALRILT